jgi:hypothetical protein
MENSMTDVQNVYLMVRLMVTINKPLEIWHERRP